MMSTSEDYWYEEESQEICGIKVPSILNDFIANQPPLVDRFYTKLYYVPPNKPDEPQQILFHSNRICLVGLAKKHVAFTKGIRSVSFEVGKFDRSENKVSGRKKSGGMILQADSTLALVTCVDDSVYKVRSCVQGKLVEVNDRVVEDPVLMRISGEGFVAIVMPKIEHCDALKERLLGEEAYHELREVE
ncbi:protein Abitram [Anopheles maculipalpis]|uniref:protein Abitram n=1 Tax=Anopheles maculipalpis TaxID=1496333 RepID=UPI00215941F0|nr:protein Abitram [Anopheles maculipalpis]